MRVRGSKHTLHPLVYGLRARGLKVEGGGVCGVEG